MTQSMPFGRKGAGNIQNLMNIVIHGTEIKNEQKEHNQLKEKANPYRLGMRNVVGQF